MGLSFEYNIKNIGNIKNTTITIKPLTIIAGENSSGKTFLTKSLYTILNSIYQNYFSDNLIKEYQLLNNLCIKFIEDLNKPVAIDKEFNTQYTDYSKRIAPLIQGLVSCDFEEQEKLIDLHQNIFKEFNLIITDYFNNRKSSTKFEDYFSLIEDILQSLKNLLYIVNNRRDMIIDSINASLETGLKKNYQITSLNSLINKNQDENLSIDIENIGNINIDMKSNVNFNFNQSGIQKIQDVKNIVFFDSPVYLKIRKALEKGSSGLFKFFNKDDDKYLKGYPEYLERLYNFVDKEYIGTADFNEISNEIQNIISGKLDIAKSGDIQYTDNHGSSIPLSLTAMGISNIGLIDLLLRNNIINKGSFLIMDEPEVHLHPKWQVELANILYKIAKSGATIIIATHSLDFLKAFQVLLNQEKEDESIIAVNKMPFSEEFTKLSEKEKIDEILDDLSEPYCNLFI